MVQKSQTTTWDVENSEELWDKTSGQLVQDFFHQVVFGSTIFLRDS